MKSISLKASAFVTITICCFISLPSYTITAQKFPCTHIDLRCPSYTVAGNTGIRFSADVVGARQILGAEAAKLITYKWEVSGGTIIDGRDTFSILVEPYKSSGNNIACITATVKVNGVDPTCESIKSCAATFDLQCSQPDLFDHFGNLSVDGEKTRLDTLAAKLIKDKSQSVVYIVVYAGRTACIGEAVWRANRAKRYLKEKHNVSGDRIITVDGGFREHRALEIFLGSRSSCGPTATPAIKASDAEIVGLCQSKDD